MGKSVLSLPIRRCEQRYLNYTSAKGTRYTDIGIKAPGLGMHVCIRALLTEGSELLTHVFSETIMHWLCTKCEQGGQFSPVKTAR